MKQYKLLYQPVTNRTCVYAIANVQDKLDVIIKVAFDEYFSLITVIIAHENGRRMECQCNSSCPAMCLHSADIAVVLECCETDQQLLLPYPPCPLSSALPTHPSSSLSSNFSYSFFPAASISSSLSSSTCSSSSSLFLVKGKR